MTPSVESSNEILFEYLRDVEDTLTSLHQRLAHADTPEPDEIQREIAAAVVMLYGIRQNYCPDQTRPGPHPIVFSGYASRGWKSRALEEMVAKASCGAFVAAGAD